jgi:hypothetical protein
VSDLTRIENQLCQIAELLRCLTQEVRRLRTQTPVEIPVFLSSKLNPNRNESGKQELKKVATRGKGIRKVRYQGIGEAARKLGVTRFHVLRVIQGRNQSRRIETWLKRNLRRAS